ncbi:MAG: DUF3791 domain-containing protein [Prevotella sp.]|jgi:hypothetical protein|nr:DUF3791 domain-containing protein [Prevotella sp.]
MLSSLLLWNKIGRIVTLLSERLGISSEKALELFYQSKANEWMRDPDVKLYLMSDWYIADEVINELQKSSHQPT